MVNRRSFLQTIGAAAACLGLPIQKRRKVRLQWTTEKVHVASSLFGQPYEVEDLRLVLTVKTSDGEVDEVRFFTHDTAEKLNKVLAKYGSIV